MPELTLKEMAAKPKGEAKKKYEIYEISVEELRDKAESGDPNSQYDLGLRYWKGYGIPQDYKEAAKWWTKAAEQGHAEAQFRLALLYFVGSGVPQDTKEAVKWYTRAAEQGHAEAQLLLGMMYNEGKGVLQDTKEAVKWYTRAAEQGLAHAQGGLGLMYHQGEGVPQDYKEAFKWCTKAAEQGHAEAQYNLGCMYDEGEGVPQHYKEAVKWWTKAAEQGYAEAQYNLGCMYDEGEGVPQHYKEAVKWWTKAAEQGHAKAQFNLGMVYNEGKGVLQDTKEAVKWLTEAADQGLAHAQSGLGLMYHQGEGVPQDYKEAIKWYTKAAEQGLAEAQFNLALMYTKSQGVPEDYIEAYKWAILAAMNGLDAAQYYKQALRMEMTPSQIEQAQSRAKEFVAEQERRSKEDKQGLEKVTSNASAFFITPEGCLLTSCHGVERAGRVEVFYKQKKYPAKVVFKDESLDVAILKIDGSGFHCLPLISNAMVKTGDMVFTVGFPQVALQGTEPKFTEGSISSLSGLAGNPRYFQISVPVQPGNSGGPLVNEKGEVIGMIVSRLDDVAALLATGSIPQTVNYAVKSSFILLLLESVPNLTGKLVKPSPAVDRSAAIDKTKQAVVLVVRYNDGLDPIVENNTK